MLPNSADETEKVENWSRQRSSTISSRAHSAQNASDVIKSQKLSGVKPAPGTAVIASRPSLVAETSDNEGCRLAAFVATLLRDAGDFSIWRCAGLATDRRC
ncbi:unnamed protein product [Lampetra planeri]